MIDSNKLKKYLNNRYPDANGLLAIIETANSETQFEVFNVDGEDYIVSHFLDCSEKLGWDLLVTNKQLKLDQSNLIAIALVEGDDVICVDSTTREVGIWLVQSGEGEYLKIADSIEKFWSLIKKDDRIKQWHDLSM